MSLDATTVEIHPPPPPESTPATADRPTLGEVLVLAAAFALIAALMPFRDYWVVQVLLLLLLTTAPGIVLLRLLQRTGRDLAILAVPASIVILLVSGLATDVVGGALGETRPLQTGPLLTGLEIVGVAMLAGLAVRLDENATLRIPLKVPSPSRALPILLPLGAAAGALELNASGSSALALVCVVLGAVLAVVVFVRGDRLSDGTITASIYAIALASLWSFSLRSESIFGFDVTTEFRKMGETLAVGAWQFAHPNDAYGAMLSVTILPVELQQLAGVSLPLVVKLVYPALFALAPVLVFHASRCILRARWSVLAALLVIMQVNFGLQMPQLARQEIALLLFAGLLLVMVRQTPQRWSQLVLVGLLSVGIVLTHYSTTYFSIALLLVAAVILGVLTYQRRATGVLLVVVVSLVVLLAGAVTWNGALTRSTANVSSVLESFGTSGFRLLPDRGGGGLLSGYLNGTVTPEIPAPQYEDAVIDYYMRNRPYVLPSPDSAAPQYALADVPPRGSPAVVAASGLLGFVLRNLIYVAAAVGSVLLLVRRPLSSAGRILGASALASVLALVIVRVSGTVAEAYNQDRALLQALFVLAPAAGWCLQTLAVRIGRRRSELRRTLSFAVVVLLLAQIGVASSLLAFLGHSGGANLTSDSEDVSRQYVRQGELAGARWLGQRAPVGQLVYADRYGSLRFLLATGRFQNVLQELVPPVIDSQAWVYASATNVTEDTARSQTANNLGRYRFPDQFLADHFDVVYTNGQSRVYHGASLP